ncbi:MAG: DNA replication and repair protein RecF [Solirubrobacteraceae bacterium]
MRLTGVTLRDFRCYHDADASLGAGLTVVCGPNGAGKTNLLEGLYFGCTGRSCRTANEREVVRFGAPAARIVVRGCDDVGEHELSVGFAPGQAKRMRVDGALVERLLDNPNRPLLGVFLPDRLELVKGAPALRRAHLDQLVAALWPARAATRRSYVQTLAQRNALLLGIRAGRGSRASLRPWDAQLAHSGIALMRDREHAVGLVDASFKDLSAELGLGTSVSLSYCPRSRAGDAAQLAAELAERVEGDLERGHTGHGPHRDELTARRDGRDLRTYGSQGQQRLALLALLLAERETLARHRRSPPVMLLDDVMSELDRTRRQALVELLRSGAGQSVITTTDLDHVPGGCDEDVVRLEVADGRIGQEVAA